MESSPEKAHAAAGPECQMQAPTTARGVGEEGVAAGGGAARSEGLAAARSEREPGWMGAAAAMEPVGIRTAAFTGAHWSTSRA